MWWGMATLLPKATCVGRELPTFPLPGGLEPSAGGEHALKSHLSLRAAVSPGSSVGGGLPTAARLAELSTWVCTGTDIWQAFGIASVTPPPSPPSPTVGGGGALRVKILRRLQVPPMDTPSRDRNSCPLKSPATREGRSRQRFSHWVGREAERGGGREIGVNDGRSFAVLISS